MDLFLAKYADRTRPAFVLLDEVQYFGIFAGSTKAQYMTGVANKICCYRFYITFYGQNP